MSRLVVARLWPMLLALAALLAGALLLEGYVLRRANDPLRVVIAEEHAGGGVDEPQEGSPAAPEGAGDAEPITARRAQARALARRGEFAKALPLFEEELAAAPASPALLAEYGRWLAASGSPDRGLELLQRADALRPSFTTALRIGQLRASLGDPAAAADLRRALALRPRSAQASLALGQLLLREGDRKEALALLKVASASGSNDDRARALVALGGAHLATGARAEAERAFEKAIQYAPARVDVRVAIADEWLEEEGKDRAQRAMQALAKAVEISPDLPQVHAAIGQARERTGDKQLAQDAYELALRLDPTYGLARRRLVRLALSRNDLARARLEVERLVSDAPDVAENHFLAARVASAEGRTDDARAAYRRAIDAAQGDYPEALLNLGVLERGAGDFAAARAAYDGALRRRPRYVAAWIDLGRLQEAEQRLADAERSYRKAVEIDGRSGAAWLALGQLLSDLSRWAEAEAALRRAVDLARGDSARLSLGVVFARTGKLDQAIAAYRAVLAGNPRNVAAWYDLALAELRRGRRAEARTALGNALDVDATHAASLAELGRLELADGRLAQARRAFEDLLDVAPGDRRARSGLAEADALAGDRAGCERRLAQLRADEPGDATLGALAARCAEVQSARAGPSRRTP